MRIARSPAMARTAGSWRRRWWAPAAPAAPRVVRPARGRPSSRPSVVRSFVPARSAVEARRSDPAVPGWAGAHGSWSDAAYDRPTAAGYPAPSRVGKRARATRSHVRRGCGCRAPRLVLAGREMSASPGTEPTVPGPAGDTEAVSPWSRRWSPRRRPSTASTGDAEPVWANARARALGTARGRPARRSTAGRSRDVVGQRPAHRAARDRLRRPRWATAAPRRP